MFLQLSIIYKFFVANMTYKLWSYTTFKFKMSDNRAFIFVWSSAIVGAYNSWFYCVWKKYVVNIFCCVGTTLWELNFFHKAWSPNVIYAIYLIYFVSNVGIIKYRGRIENAVIKHYVIIF